MVAGSIAAGATILAVPRAVVPRELPLPAIDGADLGRRARGERERLDKARQRPLPYLVRAAGDALRKYGVAEAGTDAALSDAARREFVGAVDAARKRYGDGPLLDLRAVQTELFVGTVAHFRGTRADEDTIELGGGFVTRAQQNGWIDSRGRLLLDADEIACLFRVRWSHLAGLLETFPFSPSLNDWRLYYRTLLWDPKARTGAISLGEGALLGSYVDALARRDPAYPVLLARGILEYWSGRFADATELLAQHLARHPTGPWRLRAQNYLLAAYARAPR